MVVWNFPTRIVFGAGSLSELGGLMKPWGFERVLVVTDPGVRSVGLSDRVVQQLSAAGISSETFSDIAANPTEADVERGAAAYRDSQAQTVVAVGGGAPMDTAKLILVRNAVGLPWQQLDDSVGGDRHIPADLPPSVAIPTTAGTGSEVGRAGVLTVAATGRKTVVFHPSMLPRLALLDPELTLGLPAGVTAATGFDALTHSVEAYLSKGDHPMADSIALMGIELAASSLERAVQHGGDVQARGDMMKAAMMGAVAFQKGLGACHSLAHPLSSLCDLHHGLANAVCLPAVIDFNTVCVPERVERIARLLPGGDSTCSERLRELRAAIGLPGSLAALGVAREQLSPLADLAVADACHTQNPRDCTRDDLLSLYEASF